MTGRVSEHSVLGMRLQGRWLVVLRLIWLAITLLAVVLFVLGLSLYFAELLYTICTAPTDLCRQQGLLTLLGRQELSRLGLSLRFHAWFIVTELLISQCIWWAVALLIFWRKSADWMALLVALGLVTFIQGPPLEALTRSDPAWTLLGRGLTYVNYVAVTLFLYLFPNGKFAPRWMRWLAVVVCIAEFLAQFFPDSSFNYTHGPGWLAITIGSLSLGSYLFAQIYHYHRVSNSHAQQQTKWVVLGTTVGLILVISTALWLGFDSSRSSISIGYYVRRISFRIGFLLIPLSIGIAILRYRLFDIDIIIRRTLIYSVLTLTLGVVYIGSILLSRILVAPLIGGSDLAIVASTLAIAALFFPLRRRIQNLIDKRFYRRKYDAVKVLTAYAMTARDETDLERLTAELMRVVDETMQPEFVGLWMRDPSRPTRSEANRES